MLVLKLDSLGSLQVRWPDTIDETLELGRRYVARERSLPEAGRLPIPSLDRVAALHAKAVASKEAADKSEINRATAAERLGIALTQARPMLKEAILQLKARYSKSQAGLGAWGLSVKPAKTGGGSTVSGPRKDAEWLDFLLAYAAREASLPEEERLPEPPLAPLARLAEVVLGAREDRAGGAEGRADANEERDRALTELRERLQVAAVVLTELRFNGAVERSLAEWGYRVVEHTAGPKG